MTSLPNSFFVGSASSAQSVRDAIASYRRAQYLVAGSGVVSLSDASDSYDDESAILNDYEAGISHLGDTTPTQRDELVGQFEWDEDVGQTPETSQSLSLPLGMPRTDQPPSLPGTTAGRKQRPSEYTPLLRKAVSFSTSPHPRRVSAPPPMDNTSGQKPDQEPYYRNRAASSTLRRPSISSAKSIKYAYGGKSTFGQTLFNSIAILLGIGMLSEPLAFAYAGWATGTVLIISYGFISCYTAKILARIILSDPRLRSYADIGRKAFGPNSTFLISVIFCLELFAVSVVLVTLYADSLHSIIPQHSTSTYKLWGLILLIPTVFLPLSLLSYTSILGIISTALIILVILIDGFSKPDAPGSLWSPAATSVGVENWGNLGVAFGLFMAGFSGHAVIPSLARDMVDPTEFDRMIDWAFVIATAMYTLIGYAGYLMFGRDVSDEISMDLLNTPGYNYTLNQAALWMLVISPLTKFALTTQPLNATIEILFGIDAPLTAPGDPAARSNGLTTSSQGTTHIVRRRFLAVFQRVVLTALSVGVSILVPEFSSMMAFLGSFSAFLLCVIGPVSAKIALAGRCGVFDGCVLVLGVIMAIWGTVAAFIM